MKSTSAHITSCWQVLHGMVSLIKAVAMTVVRHVEPSTAQVLAEC